MAVDSLKEQSYWEERLVKAGFTAEQARVLVLLPVDLHRAEELVKQGCDPGVAFDIFS